MKYKNTKTGAIIDVPCKISGADWVKYAVEKEEVEVTEEYVEEEVDLEEMTNKELEAFAEKEGIKLTTEDKKNKDTRIAAIVKAFG